MDILVVAGGLSTERDVSFVTGDMVSKALRGKGHRVILWDVFMGYGDKEEDLEGIFDRAEEVSVQVGKISAAAPDLAAVKVVRADQSDNFFGPNVLRLGQMADIVFMGLHGENGENGKVQAAFDLFGIKYTGSDYLSSAIAMKKELSKIMYRAAGVPTPKGLPLKKEDTQIFFSETGLSFPAIVKPQSGGSSIGVSIVHNEEEYARALEEAFRYETDILAEEFIQGREFSVGVIEGTALPVIEITPIEGFYDYANKYKAGAAVETCPADLPAELSERMQFYAVEAAKALGLTTYSRTDFMMNDQGEMFCLESNTLPGMTATSLMPQEAQAMGMDYGTLCEHLIEVSMKKYS